MAGTDDRSRTRSAGTSPTTPPAGGGLRDEVARLSRPLLLRLSTLPKFAVPLITIVVLAIGVLAPVPVGVAALGLVLLWMLWLAYLSWPAVGTGGRLMRLATVAVLGVAIAMRVIGG